MLFINSTSYGTISISVCLNVFEVQPVATSSSQLNVLLPGNALTGAPCRVSNNPVKRIAPLTVKVLYIFHCANT